MKGDAVAACAAWLVALTLLLPSGASAGTAGSARVDDTPTPPPEQAAPPPPARHPSGPQPKAFQASGPSPQQAEQYLQAEALLRKAAVDCPINAACYTAMADYNHCLAKSLDDGPGCGTPPSCGPQLPPCNAFAQSSPATAAGDGPAGPPVLSPSQGAALDAASSHEAQAQADLASGQGDAINEQLQAQLYRIQADAAARGSSQAATAIGQSASTAAMGQAVGGAITGAGMALFDIWAASNARDEAAREQRQAQLNQQHDRAEAVAETWQNLAGLVAQVRRRPDFNWYQRSPEHQGCASTGIDRLDPDALVRDLDNSGDSDQDVQAQHDALVASGRAGEGVKCLVQSYGQWSQRMRHTCSDLLRTAHDELGQVRSEQPDIPQGCFDAAEQAYRDGVAGAFKVGGSQRRVPQASGAGAAFVSPDGLGLKTVGGASPAPTAPAPTAQPGGLVLKPIH